MTKFLLPAIILLAAFLRIFLLDFAPPHLNWDEVSHGYNAYSILKTGKDEWGEFFPLTSFRAFGDYKLPLYIYLTVPLVALFGLNEWAVRLPSALAGVGAVIFTFFIAQKLFKNSSVAAISALLLTISPWHFMVSRAAFEANLALFLVILGAFLFIKGTEKEKFLPFSLLSFGLSLYAYNSAKIFVPLLLISLFIFYRKELRQKIRFLLISLLIFVLLFIPHLSLLGSEEGQNRFYWTTILDEGAINRINEARITSNLPEPLGQMIHNKATYFTTTTFNHWLSHFSPRFLFFEGGSHYQYSIPGYGVAFPIELPFITVGIFLAIKERRKSFLLFLFWFLWGPLASSITKESPQVLRSIFTLPSLQILGAFGFVKVGEWLKGRKYKTSILAILGIITILVAFSASFFIEYFSSYRKAYSWSWQYGYKEVASSVMKNYDSYETIVFTKKYGEPHEFLLFFSSWPPDKYRNDPNLVRFFRSNWYWVDRFDKFYFVNDWQIPKTDNEPWMLESGEVIPIMGKTLLITSPGNSPPEWKFLESIKFLDGKPAFELYEKIT